MTNSREQPAIQRLKQRIAECIRQGDFPSAEAACSQLTQIAGPEEGNYIRGVLQSARGNHAGALSLLEEAHQKMPTRSDVAYNLGVALRGVGRLAEAAGIWQEAVRLDPKHLDAWRNLCLAVNETVERETASQCYQEALSHHPRDAVLLYNYGNLCFRRNHFEEALAVQAQLLKHHPTHAAGWINAGLTLKAAGLFKEAENCYRQSIALNNPVDLPLAHFNLANLLLLQGRWEEGFAEYEWRLKLPGTPPPPWPAPDWTPNLAVGSRILVWNDQGLGDGIQFLRFVKPLAERGYRVFLFVQDLLKSLAATTPGVEASWGTEDKPAEIEAHLPMCRLPNVLGGFPERFWAGRYLFAPQDAIRLPLRRMGGTTSPRRIGIVWAGNPQHPNDRNRSLRLNDLAPLLDLSDIVWFSLQKGRGPAELASSAWAGRMVDLSPHISDFATTAAWMEQLDLIISVDTAAAHLAGALGRPTWVLLPRIESDWRWGIEGETTPWYPTMHLFRQETAGDWMKPVGRIAARLVSEGGQL